MPGRNMPYRGDGFSKDFEPRRRLVNLRKLRWSLLTTILGIIVVPGAITFFVLHEFSTPNPEDKTHIAALVIMWLFVLMIIAGILDLNKFRKSRDVDISGASKDDDNSDKTENFLD